MKGVIEAPQIEFLINAHNKSLLGKFPGDLAGIAADIKHAPAFEALEFWAYQVRLARGILLPGLPRQPPCAQSKSIESCVSRHFALF